MAHIPEGNHIDCDFTAADEMTLRIIGRVWAAAAPLLLVGIWIQMTGFIERITLTPDEITWIDWTGRRRVQASIADITGLVSDPNEKKVTVFTTQGPVSWNYYLWGDRDLLAKIRQIVELRESEALSEAGNDW